MVEKYKKITITVLTIVLIIISLCFLDRWFLPQTTSKDEIIAYTKKYHRTKSGRGPLMGYRFETKNELKFTIEDDYITESMIEVNQTLVLKSITSVKTKDHNYTDKLLSGINGVSSFLIILLTFSSVISLVTLIQEKNISKNSFQNIILINSFMLIITLLMIIHYN